MKAVAQYLLGAAIGFLVVLFLSIGGAPMKAVAQYLLGAAIGFLVVLFLSIGGGQ
jgi:integral membrane sensor domain MASE1